MGDIKKDIQSEFPSEHIKALINIKYTANWIAEKERIFFKSYDISAQQFNILRILRGFGAPMAIKEIRARMIERSVNATRMLDKLEKKDLILIKTNSACTLVEISTAGLFLLAQIDAQLSGLHFLDTLDQQELQTLNTLLDKAR